MTADRWNKIKALFSAAQERPEVERKAFLLRSCGEDRELLNEVERLLDSHIEDDSFLEASAAADFADLFGAEILDEADLKKSMNAPPRLESGAVLDDRYTIVRLLGRGGMGEVYLATDARINRNVALKVLHTDLVSNKESLRRFALEAQAVSALNHPHILTIYDFATTGDGTSFIVAEYVDGKALNYLIRGGLELDKALDIAIQVSSALAAAHEAGITHRDIKPENIMVRRDGYIKVLDFGLAKLTQSTTLSESSASEAPTQALTQTRPGMIMGTAAYMSPEQARGLDVDARADIWSVGAVLYEMLTGRRPFSGETQADVIVSVLLSDPAPVSAARNGLPAELDLMVSRCLSKDVAERYQTIEELRSDLDNLRKRIAFDESFSVSAGSGLATEGLGEAVTLISTAPNVVRTADDGARPTDGGANGDSSPPRSSWPIRSFAGVYHQAQTHKIVVALIALAAAAVLGLGGYFVFVTPPAETRPIDSIAVLPFENLSGNPDLNYVSDGLSETLIDRLAQLPQLKVVSRSSSFKFRGPNLDLRKAASELGARAIVTGSVAQAGDRLTIRVDVVDTVDDRQLAGGQYLRKTGDLLSVQREIAQTTTEPLRLQMTDSQADRVSRNGTDDDEANRYYLSGLVELNGPQDVRGRALEYFERAVALDPEFAAAHAEIAWIYWSRANGSSDPHELMPKARASVERALSIDPNLAKGHALMAMVHEYEFDWQGAESEYTRAIELSPNLDFTRNNYAFFLSVMGRQDEALAQLEEQRIRDPINRRLALLQKGIILSQARRFDEALRAYQDAQAEDPAREVPNFALGYAYGGKGLHNEAAGYYRKSIQRVGGDEKYSQALVYLAATYAKMPEKRADALAILRKIEAMDGYSSPALLAAVYASLDDDDAAIELLEKAYIRRDLLLRFIGTGYEYDGVRDDPRFRDLTSRIGLTQSASDKAAVQN